MIVEDVPIPKLRSSAAPYNPRKIDEHDLEALKRSLTFFGPVEPCVINTRSGNMVGGHQRIAAAEALGWESFPTVYVDLDDPSERQLNAALNRISGQWDEQKLREMLEELDAVGADLSLTGFSQEELDAIVGADIDPIDPPDPGDVGGGDGSFEQITFILSREQAETVKRALELEKQAGGGAPSLGNENENGCALYSIATRAVASRAQ